MAKKTQDKAQTIEFVAAVARVSTLADGGLRITLDLPESAILQAAHLMECRRTGAVLQVNAIPKWEGDKQEDEWPAI